MKRATREAVQRKYRQQVIDSCKKWKPGLIARARAKHTSKYRKEK